MSDKTHTHGAGRYSQRDDQRQELAAIQRRLGGRIGMKTMDNSLMELVDKGCASGHMPYQPANNKHRFEKVKDTD
jgi:hypothetical protein